MGAFSKRLLGDLASRGRVVARGLFFGFCCPSRFRQAVGGQFGTQLSFRSRAAAMVFSPVWRENEGGENAQKAQQNQHWRQ